MLNVFFLFILKYIGFYFTFSDIYSTREGTDLLKLLWYLPGGSSLLMIEVYCPLILPSDYDEMNNFIVKNKIKLMENVVSSVRYALVNNLASVEVFKFENSDFIVILEYSTFKDNINNIYDFYISEELYELCDRVNKLKKLLESHEKKQEKRYKSKSSTKRKT